MTNLEAIAELTTEEPTHEDNILRLCDLDHEEQWADPYREWWEYDQEDYEREIDKLYYGENSGRSL